MQGGNEEEEAFRHRLRRALSQSWPHKRKSLIPPTLLQSFSFFPGLPSQRDVTQVLLNLSRLL